MCSHHTLPQSPGWRRKLPGQETPLSAEGGSQSWKHSELEITQTQYQDISKFFGSSFGRAAFRDSLLSTPGWEQGSHSLTAKSIGKGPYFPAASQLRTCTEWNVFLRE